MKKLFYTLLVATVGLLTASCMQEHVEAIYDPAAATAQTLASISDVVLEAEGDAITTTFNPADFKMTVASTYTLFASAASDMSDKVKASATLSVDESGIGHISMKQSTVNSMVFALGGEADVPFTVYFQLEGAMANDKNGAIGATMLYSNIVSATFTPYSMDIKDVDLYEHVWVIGASANVGGWSFDKVFQYLYNYEKTGTTFTGLIDFGEAGPSGGFKLVGVNNWDDESKNWGSEAQAEEPEQATIQLIAAGSSKDIKCYSKRFYFFSYDTGTLVLTAKYAIDNVGIVGAFNGWNEKDANMKMEYNPYYHRFYIDYTFDDATELKFTCNDAWEINWGGKDGTIAGGGDNIAVEPGSYRIYLDINHGTYEFSTSMYGKNEPTGGDEPEPEPEVRADWYYHGQSESEDWGELPFTKVSDTEYVLELTTKVANAGFVMKNGDATKWIGADASLKGDDGKYVVELDKEFKISEDKVDGVIAEPGDYVFTFNPVDMTAIIKKAVRADWYYHGQSATSDWGELPFKKVSDTEYVLELTTKIDNAAFVLKNGDESKWIGADASLKGEDGKAHIEINKEFKISEDKVDAVIEKAGQYIFTFNPVDMTAIITSNRADWYYHGQSASSDWGELPFKKVSDTEYVLELTTKIDNAAFVLKNGDESKWIGADASLKGEDGKAHIEINKEFKISEDKVDAVIEKAGQYIFTFNPVDMTAIITSNRADWYYHGQSASSDWGELPFKKVSDTEYVLELTTKIDNAAFVLKNGDESKWIGADASLKGEDNKAHIVLGQEFKISEDKVDAVIEKAGKYTMTFYVNEMKAVIATAEPDYYYHGQSKRTPNWGAIPFEKVSDDEYYVIVEVEAGYAFVLKNADGTSWFGAAAAQKGEDGKFHVVAETEFDIDADKVDAVFDVAGTYKLTIKPTAKKAVAKKL